MIARPILFSSAMVRALIDGRKFQTRRVCKYRVYSNGIRYDAATGDIPCHDDYLPPSAMLMDVERGGCRYTTSNVEGWAEACPYGVESDLLWVRETWQHAPSKLCHCPQPSEASPCDEWSQGIGCRSHRTDVIYRADAASKAPVWRSPIHCPRWASRLTLKITDVRVERLQDISEADCIAEGVYRYDNGWTWQVAGCDGTVKPAVWSDPRSAYFDCIDSVNHKSVNDFEPGTWLWCLTFEVIPRNVDSVIAEARAA